MKQKHFLRVVTILLAFCMLALSSVSSLAVEARWENTTSRDENNNIVIDFAELQVILPSDWGGKVQMNISSDHVSFYHIQSREKWTEELGYANGGHLFTIVYTTDYSYMDYEPSYMTIGRGCDGIYYATFPTDFQAYTGDLDICNEYISLSNDLDWIKANMTISVSVITILDDEFIFPQSSDSYLSESDLYGMTADEVQMAINEIYARHHRRFVLQEVQAYFDSKSWYSGTIEADDFDVSVMNVYENANIALMVNRISELNAMALSDEYILPQSSDTYLNESDLYGMTADEIQMAINEIYARHHRRFVLQEVQAYFDSKSWYSGTIAADDFDVSVLNIYEGANIELMKKRIAQLNS